MIKGQWSKEENELLIKWVNKNGPRKWSLCSKIIPGRGSKQCREHWNDYLNPKIIKGNWTAEEDFLLMYFYYKFKGSWKVIINAFNNRTENSIKNRFYSELRKIATYILSLKGNKISHKLGLNDLLIYLNLAICYSKERYLNEKNYSEKDLNNFLNKIEEKIKLKKIKKLKKKVQMRLF